jgi:nitroimidazol reductase NimA-like FMN-containing flavoprotein (pyridoxamine 5'-phosphate oxidase superfamily)
MADLDVLARQTIADNRFMVLGTVDPSGRARVSPVWFSIVDHREIYWLSNPDSHHSQNIADRPDVAIVVFDSRADPHTGQAVYLEATAERVAEHEVEAACAAAFEGVDDALSFTPETLEDEPFVLFRARVTSAEIHVRGRDVGEGQSDRRVRLDINQ